MLTHIFTNLPEPTQNMMYSSLLYPYMSRFNTALCNIWNNDRFYLWNEQRSPGGCAFAPCACIRHYTVTGQAPQYLVQMIHLYKPARPQTSSKPNFSPCLRYAPKPLGPEPSHMQTYCYTMRYHLSWSDPTHWFPSNLPWRLISSL